MKTKLGALLTLMLLAAPSVYANEAVIDESDLTSAAELENDIAISQFLGLNATESDNNTMELRDRRPGGDRPGRGGDRPGRGGDRPGRGDHDRPGRGDWDRPGHGRPGHGDWDRPGHRPPDYGRPGYPGYRPPRPPPRPYPYPRPPVYPYPGYPYPAPYYYTCYATNAYGQQFSATETSPSYAQDMAMRYCQQSSFNCQPRGCY